MSGLGTVAGVVIARVVMQRWADAEKHKAWPYVGVSEHVVSSHSWKPRKNQSIRPAYTK